jgi:hypothetical protein
MAFWTILLLAIPLVVWLALAIAKLSLRHHAPWIWVDRGLWVVGGVIILTSLEVSVRVPLDKDTLLERFGLVDRIWWSAFVALGLILATSATALARDVGEALLNAVKRTGDAKTPWGLQTLSSSLVVWATLVAFRLKPLHDAFSALTNRRAVEL